MAISPMVESAIKILELEGSELTFNQLWDKVIEEMQIDKDTATKKIAKLYSDLTLDKRVISLPENKWDLKKRRKLDETIVDLSHIIIDDEEEIDLDELVAEDYDYEDDEDKVDDDEDLDDLEDDLDVDDDLDAEELMNFETEELDSEFEDDIEEFEELAIASED